MREELEGMKTNHEVFWFKNMWGASVVKDVPDTWGSFGRTKEGFPYEIAVINKRGKVDYTTAITNDTLKYLTVEQAVATLEAISEL